MAWRRTGPLPRGISAPLPPDSALSWSGPPPSAHAISLLSRLSVAMTNYAGAAPGESLEDPGRPPAHLPWLLRRVNRRFRSMIGQRLSESGLTVPQPGYWALMALARGATDAGQLVEAMGVSKQAVSKLVDVLVTSGFVDRTPNDADRRRTDLRLSAMGRRAAGVIEDATRAVEGTFVAELGSERFTSLVRMLARLAAPPGQ
jgi:DNA-binding MarR family transcriptional regulator